MDEHIRIRTAVPGDAPALLAIYAPYVEKTVITFEYEVPSLQEFRGRIERTLEKHPYLAAVSGTEKGEFRPKEPRYKGPLALR